jgi:hypothetical protein
MRFLAARAAIFGAGGEMRVERALKPRGAGALALAANLALMTVSWFSLGGARLGFLKPSVSMMAVLVGLPWVAAGMVWCFPGRFFFFPVPFDRRLTLFGVLFFTSMAPFSTYCYAPFVRKLPVLELACVVGAVLFAALLVSEVRAKGNPVLMTIALPLSVLYGYAAVVQLNCVLDHSPATVYKTVVSNKSLRRPSLDMDPWGPAPEPKSILTQYHALVPRQIFDAVQVGGPICVVQSAGALGISWYSAQVCPWNGQPVVLGVEGSLAIRR